jgi:SHS2 domain-containing protein
MFEFLPHVADVYIKASGKTLEEAFAQCALGLEQTMVEIKDVKPEIEKKFEIESEDEKSLLFDFLSQFLIFHDVDNLIFSEVKVESIKKNEKFKLKAVAKGEVFDANKHRQNTLVKAITYHEMEIKKNGEFIVKVLVDI